MNNTDANTVSDAPDSPDSPDNPGSPDSPDSRCTAVMRNGNSCRYKGKHHHPDHGLLCGVHMRAENRRLTCSICINDMKPSRRKTLPCGHGFHASCINGWLARGTHTCPVCRAPTWTDDAGGVSLQAIQDLLDPWSAVQLNVLMSTVPRPQNMSLIEFFLRLSEILGSQNQTWELVALGDIADTTPLANNGH